MENKTIDIEPRAAVEMQTWENIYDRVPLCKNVLLKQI